MVWASILLALSLASVLQAQSSLSDYPVCAQICQYELQGTLSDPTNPQQLCGPTFRAATATCQVATCSESDLQAIAVLSQQFCGPFYGANSTLGSAVSAALASATPIAIAATAGKDASDVSNYPQCAQECQRQYDFGGCGGLSNRTCICQGNPRVILIDICERANCSSDDIIRESSLAQKLCQPVGGIFENTTNPLNKTSNTTVSSSPSPSPFTGSAVIGASAGSVTSVFLLVMLTGVLLL